MNPLESILRDDALVKEIAGRVPLLQTRLAPTAIGGREGAVRESAVAGSAATGTVPMTETVVTVPALTSPGSGPESRNAVETAVSGAGLNEAIVKRFGRPVLLVRNDTFEIPASDTWKAILYPYKSKIDAAIPRVGRVELVSAVPPFLGTAWMVSKDIAVTNRHVALEFARQRNGSWDFRRSPVGKQVRVRVDFKEEYLQTNAFEVEVEEILFVSELQDSQPDLAFIRLKSNGQLPAPVPLFDGTVRDKQKIAVIGYPAEDPRNAAADQARIFANIFDVKRVAPGEITSVGEGSVFTHDCTTLGGNSGSVVIDIETGMAIGLHFAGEYLQDNYAVRASTVKEFLKRVDQEVVLVAPPVPKPLEEATFTLEDIQGRDGYDPSFLGEEKFAVPLPVLGPGLDELTVVVDEAADGTEKYMLPYTHFSLAMHNERRMALFTVSNIDGEQSRKLKRKKDVWAFDPRVDRELQIGNDLYTNNDLDRGHLVRRMDPTWGTPAEAKKAELDTFFFTNCTPQHSGFNQKLWLRLEEYLLDNADTRNFKASVFTGPVFSENDRPYRDVLLPLAFWKVVVMVHDERDELTATAYIVSQKSLLSDLEFVFGQFKTYQVSIAEVEQRTNLDFGHLKDFDPLNQQESVIRELVEPDDVRL
jgi:endonuclease G, mitochondrial